jgi:RNA polymerase sigma-70 factor (ECF subfamily)
VIAAVCCNTASAGSADTRTLPVVLVPVKPLRRTTSGPEAGPIMGRPCRTDPILASTQEISAFLAEVERRAYKQALFAVRDDHAALDIVQDAMLRLTEKYARKPASELPMLFQRILQNATTDYFRRQKVRNLWTTLLSSIFPEDSDGTDRDPLDSIEAEIGTTAAESAADQVERIQVMAIIEAEIGRLPPRQREAFLMRYWEDMDVAETAAAMGCSQGSVKTHCSRATHTLALALKAKGITL